MRNKYFEYLKWAIKVFILRRKVPLIGGIVITDECNLHCRHCTVAHLGKGQVPFTKIKKYVDNLYKRGCRLLYIQGGEPFLWKEKGKNLDSVINLAREKGFVKINVFTNGTFDLDSSADILWIGLEGLEKNHNYNRGKVFEKVIQNIRTSNHKNIIVNFTINSRNYLEIKEVVKYVSEIPQIKGIFFNFHIPYPNTEYLFLGLYKRRKVIDKIMSLKKEGYPIFNSISGLQAMKNNSWKRPLWLCGLINMGIYYPCCREFRNEELCKKCGYGQTVELSEVYSFKLPAIINSFRFM